MLRWFHTMFSLSPRTHLVAAVMVPVLSVLTFFFYSNWWYGDPLALVGVIKGQSLFISPAIKSVGEIRGGTRFSASFQLLNLTSAPITVIGAEMCCGTRALTRMPFTIPAHQSQSIEFSFYAPRVESITPFEGQSVIHIDRNSPLVKACVRGSILPEASFERNGTNEPVPTLAKGGKS